MHRLRILFLAALAPALFAQGGFYLHDGDTLVFYGDSITDQRLYTTFTETFVLTRFPGMHVRFVHSGWGGDRVGGGGGGNIDIRLRRDVIAYQPTVVTVMLGMNDGRYRAFDADIFHEFATGYEGIVHAMKAAAPHLRMTLIEPSPYDDVTRAPTFEGGYNAVLVRYGEFLRDLAQRNHVDTADLNGPVVEALRKANTTDADNAKKIVPDRVHPDDAGHLLMAEALLKAWKAPSIVAAVEIDAVAKSAKRADNAAVSDVQLQADGKRLSWVETDGALPMPVNLGDSIVALAIHSSDFMEALNQEPLKVTGLAEATYTLQIDGDSVGKFNAQELSAGVNLAALTTPMSKQAAQVHVLTVKHAGIHNVRWRDVQVPLEGLGIDASAAEKALDDLDERIIASQHAAAQPRAHHFELIAE